MMSYLEGHIKLKQEQFIFLLVGGIGYKIFLSQKQIRTIGKIGDPLRLFIHQHIREDENSLYGFSSFAELELFEVLTSVSGIGPKAGIKILELGDVADIKRAIVREDITFLTRVSGLGQKKAQRLVMDTKSKIEDLELFGADDAGAADALHALIGLGYSELEARDALRELPETAATAEEKVRLALKYLGQTV